MVGAIISAVVTIAGVVLEYVNTPSVPHWDSKHSRNDIKTFDRMSKRAVNEVKMIDDPKDVSFKYTTDDMFRAADDASRYNQQNMGMFATMADQVYQADVASKKKAIKEINPGLFDERDAAHKINQQLIEGELPKDVQDQIMRSSAYKAMYGGYGGNSGMGRNLSLRDLGTNSMQATQVGQQQAQAWGTMLDKMMPAQMSAGDVMKNQGISSDQAITQAFNIAGQNLNADQFNVSSSLTAAMANQKAQVAKAQLNQGWMSTSLQAKFREKENKYASDMGQRNSDADSNSSLFGGISSAGAGAMGAMSSGGSSGGGGMFG